MDLWWSCTQKQVCENDVQNENVQDIWILTVMGLRFFRGTDELRKQDGKAQMVDYDLQKSWWVVGTAV